MVYASHAATGNHAHSLSPCVPPPGVRCARCVKPYAQHPRSQLCGDSLRYYSSTTVHAAYLSRDRWSVRVLLLSLVSYTGTVITLD